MLDANLSNRPAPSLYEARTVRLRPQDVKALRQAESWGTIDPAPQRQAQANRSGADWTLYAVAALSLALTGAALGLTLVLGVAAAYLTLPQFAAGLEVAPTASVAAVAPIAPPTADEPVASAADEAPAPTPRKTTARRAKTTQSDASGRGSMSLSEYRRYLTEQANSRFSRGTAAAATANPETTEVAPAPAPTPSVAAPAPTPRRATTSRRTATRSSAPKPAPAPVVAAPAPPADDDFYAQETIGADEDLMAAEPARTAASQQVSGRLSKANNGVWILDDPLDPVAIAIQTDGDAAVYIDGELIGGAPLAVVVELGSHQLMVQAGTGTESFTIDATQGDRVCVSVKKGPKLTSCKKL